MKKIQLVLFVSVIMMFLSACTQGFEVSPKSEIKPFRIKIISEPSGAKIEVNNNYVGETPVTIKVDGWESTRTFTRTTSIIAHPVRVGGEVQSKVFVGWSEPDYTYGDKIPKIIYFNMNLVRIPEQLDLHITK